MTLPDLYQPEKGVNFVMSNSYFHVTATGKTFRVKLQLQGWGFRWDPHLRAWVNPKADFWRLDDYKKLISSGTWRGIKLSIEKHQDLQPSSDISANLPGKSDLSPRD